jgi:hypothetical protein
VRIELPGKDKILSLAEVEVFSGSENVARNGHARQSSVAFDAPAARAIDGNTDGRFEEAKSTTHTESGDDPWWEVDLSAVKPLDQVRIWNRTDNGLHARLSDFRIVLLGEGREPVWTQTVAKPPQPSSEFALDGSRPMAFAYVSADYSQEGFDAANLSGSKAEKGKGWAIGGQEARPHALALTPATPLEVEPNSTLTLAIEQKSKSLGHTLGRFRISVSNDTRASELARTPQRVRTLLTEPADERTDAESTELTQYYISEIAPELKPSRDRLAVLKKQLADLKPITTVPVLRDLANEHHRKTQIQQRGNFLDLGAEVSEGVPAAFPAIPSGAKLDRLALAHWLVDDQNPLTARVIANRYWEQIFGIGLVATSEEFGIQGDLPTHPELLDWLATELVGNHWDLKRFLKLLVTSAAYRQSSRVSPELVQRDPDNRLLARGPRFRLSAETIRDQALAVSDLLSQKMYGPPVKPPQPSIGLNAAFGSGIDWQTSPGDDRYRRGLYPTWRRSNPYPSMATFDAPNREVCTLRRTRTNTPLQALVTLNDPVYIEAAQALARRIAVSGATTEAKLRHGFLRCLARQPQGEELARLVHLYESAHEVFNTDAKRAERMATEPLGPAPSGSDMAELAAWTVVGNVLLNLDEMVLKR